jgi:beta-phosphoglucomutase
MLPKAILLDRPKAILLDMDGVVAQSMAYHVAAWQEAFRHYGLEVSPAALYMNEGAIGIETVCGLNGGHIDEGQARKIMRLQKAIFERRYLSIVCIYPDAGPFLEGLRLAGIEAALVTGSTERLVMGILRPSVRCYFSAVICGDSCPMPKPHPAPYRMALGALGLAPHECVAVENSPVGVAAARAAGLTCYGLTTTLPAEQLSCATKVFGSLEELSRHLALPA